MRGRRRRQAGRGVSTDVLARAAAQAEAERKLRERRVGAGLDPTPPKAPTEIDWQFRRMFIFAALAFAVIMAVVLRDPANDGVETFDEVTFALPAFEPDGPARHDLASELEVERLERTEDGLVRIAGWAANTDRVEIIANGEVLDTIAVTIARTDTAIAAGLTTSFVGFDGEVDVPPGTSICVARPGQFPAPGSCNRPTLDMGSQRVVAFYGVPYAPPLGTLGDGDPEDVLDRLVAQAEPYESEARPVMLAFEIIATVAQASPGSDGNFSAAIATDDIWDFVDTIRDGGGVTVIDFQTGRDEYLDQVPDYVDFLSEPDIHIALDPEWDMEEGEIPNEIIGSSEATEINQVMEFVAEIIREKRLPRKTMVVHNFTEGMIADRDLLDPPPEIDLVIHMDGHGPPQNKIGVYDRLSTDPPLYNGFKVFYQRDFPQMTPEAVLSLDPGFISYQ